MTEAGSSFTNFVTDGNVHQNAQTFNPKLYSKVGAVTGYPGPANSILAAAGDFGGKIEKVEQNHKNDMKGGRSPAAGPSYHSFEHTNEVRGGVYGKNYAPVKVCNNNQCGGRKTKRGMRKTKHGGRKTKHGMKHGMKHGGRKTKRGMKHGMKHGMRKTKRGMKGKKLMHRNKSHKSRKSIRFLKDVRDLFRMRGGEPAEVPVGSTSNGYHQYMGNQPHSNVYGLDGNLSPNDNAMANPMKIKVTNACSSSK